MKGAKLTVAQNLNKELQGTIDEQDGKIKNLTTENTGLKKELSSEQ